MPLFKLYWKKASLPPSGEISKDQINLISGAVTQPFVETVWVTTNGDMDTISRMTDLFTRLYDDGQEQELIDVLRLLYGVVGLQFPEEVKQLTQSSEARKYFLFSFLLDFDDVLLDYIAEQSDNE
jgi:hypothetical protein